jgi:hypothetical protein
MSKRYKAGLVTATEPSSSGTPYTGAASGSWIMQRQMQALQAALWPRSPGIPNSPTAVQASSANAQATVSFTAPTDNGGLTITSYTVVSSPGNIIASGSASPITITGLTNDTAYTFTVYATNSAGNSGASIPSNTVTPSAAVIGEVTYDQVGTFYWICPAGVNFVSVVVVGAPYSRTGGALSYKNQIPVVPGTPYEVKISQDSSGLSSYFITPSIVSASYGTQNRVGDGGGNGGTSNGYGAGGAGGYTGAGGTGGGNSAGQNGAGGGGGGGGGASNIFIWYDIGANGTGYGFKYSNGSGGGGGGVGLLGQGINGAGGSSSGSSGSSNQAGGVGGGGGSGGNTGTSRVSPVGYNTSGDGGNYGGANGEAAYYDNYNAFAPLYTGYRHSYGMQGKSAVRIIWGSNRNFPSTNTGVL